MYSTDKVKAGEKTSTRCIVGRSAHLGVFGNQRIKARDTQKAEGLALAQDIFSRNTRLQLKQLFGAIRELMAPLDPPKRPIGFVTPEDKGRKGTRSARSAK